jgi:hypothetical protein
VSEKDAMEATASKSEFEELTEEEQLSLLQEFFLFITENKKWWLIPIMLALALMGVLVILAGTGAAPFIYTLF